MVSNWNQFLIFDCEEGVSDSGLVSCSIRFDDQLIVWMWKIQCVTDLDVGFGLTESLRGCVIPDIFVLVLCPLME